jgi:hypothetical protein
LAKEAIGEETKILDTTRAFGGKGRSTLILLNFSHVWENFETTISRGGFH